VSDDSYPWRNADPQRKRQILLHLPDDYKAALSWLAAEDQNIIKSQAGWIQRMVMREIDRLIESETGEPVRRESRS
jgi:hypothetical protein